MIENQNPSSDAILSIISRLQAPVTDVDTLLALLSAPLSGLGLLPPKYRHYNTQPLPDSSIDVFRHFPSIQLIIIEHIHPTWHTVLAEMNAEDILEQYFCPDVIFNASPAAGQASSLGYMTLLSRPLTDFSVHILARMSREYPIDRIFHTTFSTEFHTVTWEDSVRNLLAVPARVANALGEGKHVPGALSFNEYMKNFCVRYEVLIYSVRTSLPQKILSQITFGLVKLVNIGLFPSVHTQPSFFDTTLSTIRRRLDAKDVDYESLWSQMIRSMPSTMATRSIVCSLLVTMDSRPLSKLNMDSSMLARAQVKREAQFLYRLFGGPSDDESRDVLSSLLVGRVWSSALARISVSYFAGAGLGKIDEIAISGLVDVITEVWSSPTHIKHSILNQHQYLTVLLLLSISQLPVTSDKVEKLALTPSFISCIGTYIGHGDESVRRCGMLVAEILAQKVRKKLDFGEWEGETPSKTWARDLRDLILARDIDADLSSFPSDGYAAPDDSSNDNDSGETGSDPGKTVEESDRDAAEESDHESLAGYGSSNGSRAPSPTMSELEEIERDPSLNVKTKPIQKPIYLAQLGTLIRGSGGLKGRDDDEADRIEMAITAGEELIRRKRSFGTELEENAADLVHCFVGLNDNYSLKDFQQKRQRILTALVSCCPQKSAPAMIEQFFSSQYSTEQRFAMLNSLAFGARELANLPLPPEQTPLRSDFFPSRTLPAPLHVRYAPKNGPINEMVDNLTRLALDKAKDASDRLPPDISRERKLRIRPTSKIQVLEKGRQATPSHSTQSNTFLHVAAEYFIGPLIGRFWTFLQDEKARERMTSNRQTGKRYRSAGTGLILSPLMLSGFIATLTVLVHASQNAPEWLAVIGPEALELAVTIGTRPIERAEDNIDDEERTEEARSEASVLSNSLELSLVILDACLEQDGGRSLGLEHTALLFGVEEWTTQVFGLLEKGIRVVGEGGVQELKLRRAAAGVLVKIDTLKSRWRQSMVDIR